MGNLPNVKAMKFDVLQSTLMEISKVYPCTGGMTQEVSMLAVKAWGHESESPESTEMPATISVVPESYEVMDGGDRTVPGSSWLS